MKRAAREIPFDSESSHTGLFSKNIATDVLDLGLRGRLGGQFLRIVFVVHVVAHTYEFTAIIAAGEEDDGDTQDLRRGDTLEVWGISFENELVDADRDGADEEGVEFLVVFRSKAKSVWGG